MLDLIITLLIIIPILTCTLLYVSEYREIALHKKEMDEEWIKYTNESPNGMDHNGDSVQLFNREE